MNLPLVRREVINVVCQEWMSNQYRQNGLLQMRDQNPFLHDAVCTMCQDMRNKDPEAATLAIHIAVMVYKMLQNQAEINHLDSRR